MGASVTATGRAITTFMLESIEAALTGMQKKLLKVEGLETEDDSSDGTASSWHYITHRDQIEILRAAKKLKNSAFQVPDDFIDFEAVKYADTDSGVFVTLCDNKEDAIQAADLVRDIINKAFPEFMETAFNCQPNFKNYIRAAREVVAVRGLLQGKKKYMLKVVDMGGITVDKMKVQGSEIKKADTPKIIQKFLKKMVDMILDGEEYEKVATFVNDQRRSILRKKENLILLGVAKQVNNLDKYTAEYVAPGTIRTETGGKLTIPGHVRAACNYNSLLQIFDKGSKLVSSGDKVLIYYVKPNQFDFKAVGIPAELTKFPTWFEENFVVDVKTTEQKMFDLKLKGIFSALGKEVPTPQSVLTSSLLSFD